MPKYFRSIGLITYTGGLNEHLNRMQGTNCMYVCMYVNTGSSVVLKILSTQSFCKSFGRQD
jgi:hypothetical protein